MYILVGILLLIVIVFGVSAGMQSYATAKQAQATIEVAQVAQVNAWGNLIVILTLALIILCVIGIIAWLMVVRVARTDRRRRSVKPEPPLLPPAGPIPMAQPHTLETLIQLQTLRMLQSMTPSAPASTDHRTAMDDDEPADDLPWLR